mmetsp:Transcript_42602/g.71115  ORF Transcript_42602/g.71115 Transcript_42602/m.71115 type:complete len:225 (-) Transcript_42602:109-783(-)
MQRLSGEDLLLDLLGEGIGGGVEALKGISLLSHERGERDLQLAVQLGLRLAHLLRALGVGLLLGVLDRVGRVPASGGQDLGRLGREGVEVAAVVLNGHQLRAKLAVALVQDVAHGGEHHLVEDHHQGEELSHDDGQGQVEVEEHTGVRGGSHHHVGHRDHEGGLHGRGDLNLPEGLHHSLLIGVALDHQGHETGHAGGGRDLGRAHNGRADRGARAQLGRARAS